MTEEKKYSQEEKRRLLESYRSSGLTQAGFCLQHGIPYTQFKNWCHRADDKTSPPKSSPRKKLGFCQLTPVEQEFKPLLSIIRVRLPNGCVIELPSDMPTGQLRVLFGMVGFGVC